MEAELKLDEAVIEELERGDGNAKQIAERLSKRVYAALERLVREERVVKRGWEGRGNEKWYSLPKASSPIFNRRL
jgi:hypothetical protein